MAGLFKNQQRDHEALSDLKASTEKLEEKTNKSVDKLETTVINLEELTSNGHQHMSTVKSMEQLFNNLGARTNASESAIRSLQEQMKSVENGNKQINGTWHEVEDRVSDLEEQASHHSVKISTNKNAFDRLEVEIDETRSNISGIGEAIILGDYL